MKRIKSIQDVIALTDCEAFSRGEKDGQKGFLLDKFFVTKANRERIARYVAERDELERHIRRAFHAKYGHFTSETKQMKVWRKFIDANPVYRALTKEMNDRIVKIMNAVQREHTIETNKKAA